ncbi:ATP-binding protein [Streptomyces sp. NPDC005708]|uniref:ATP-binding protein n=1 Tax=Streptomyces sp. NPDC005708 TaxID=3154564 RepID=UPI0033DC08EF
MAASVRSEASRASSDWVSASGWGTGLRCPRFVGREAELRRVADAWRCPPALVLVEGEAGIGKSRLVREALAALAPAAPRSLVAVCPPFREALTLGPMSRA